MVCAFGSPILASQLANRTESKTRSIVSEINEQTQKTSSKDLCNKYGTHPQPCGLWGFNGSCCPNHLPNYLSDLHKKVVRLSVSPATTAVMDIHKVVSTERLHELDVGITVYIRNITVEILKREGYRDKDIEVINNGLWDCLNYESRWQGLVHPPKKRETADLRGYFGGITRVEASEHRTILQVVVAVCWRFLGSGHKVTRLYALFLKYYSMRERRLSSSKLHTRDTLTETDRLFQLVLARLNEYQPIDSRTGLKKVMDTPKIHAQRHFVESVVRAGTTTITTGEAGEANNAKVKAPYLGKRTNRQTGLVSEQLAKRRREAEATSKLRVLLPQPEDGKCYDTSFLVAARTDMCTLTKHTNARGRSLTNTYKIFEFMTKAIGTQDNPRQMAAFDTTSIKGQFDDLTKVRDPQLATQQMSADEKHMSRVFGDRRVARSFLIEASEFFLGERNPDVFKTELGPVIDIKFVNNGVCPSVAFGDNRATSPYRVLQRLRSNPSFRQGKSSTDRTDRTGIWMDFVAIAAAKMHQGDDLYYARLLLLFHVQDSTTGVWTELAFVRYLSRNESKKDEEKRLALADDEPMVTRLHYSRRSFQGKEEWWYGIILMQSVVRKVHIVAGNDSAAASLLVSRGESQHKKMDEDAVFLLNNYVWEAKTSHRYQIHGCMPMIPYEETPLEG